MPDLQSQAAPVLRHWQRLPLEAEACGLRLAAAELESEELDSEELITRRVPATARVARALDPAISTHQAVRV